MEKRIVGVAVLAGVVKVLGAARDGRDANASQENITKSTVSALSFGGFLEAADKLQLLAAALDEGKSIPTSNTLSPIPKVLAAVSLIAHILADSSIELII
jgi:hypothetical protein